MQRKRSSTRGRSATISSRQGTRWAGSRPIFARLGFSRGTWQEFRAQLEAIALHGEAEESARTDHGQKYIVRGTVRHTAGRADVLTVWIILDGEDAPRFVTAYPEH